MPDHFVAAQEVGFILVHEEQQAGTEKSFRPLSWVVSKCESVCV